MRGLLLALVLLSGVAVADTNVCVTGRCGVVRQPRVNVTVVSAQEHADQLAVTNTFVHCGRRGGGYEGLGFSTASPDAACRSACFWGQRRVREIGTAWCPARRGWVAVIRYE
jgi:hypothetical protein